MSSALNNPPSLYLILLYTSSYYGVSSGPSIMTVHSKRFTSSFNPTEIPSGGFNVSSNYYY